MRTVTVYTRSGCGLCRAAEQVAAAEAGRHRVELVDVDADEDLQRAYNVRVPVVAIDGHEVLEGHVRRGDVRRALRRRSFRPWVRAALPSTPDTERRR